MDDVGREILCLSKQTGAAGNTTPGGECGGGKTGKPGNTSNPTGRMWLRYY